MNVTTATNNRPQKPVQITADWNYDDFQLLARIQEEGNLPSRREAIARICGGYRNWQSQPHSESASVVEIDDADLLPCTHRVRVIGKKGEPEYLCVFRRPCTPVQQTVIRGLDVCKSCKTQEYNIPAHAPKAAKQEDAEKEETESADTTPLPIESTRSRWFVMESTGAMTCPFILNVKVYRAHDCKMCRKNYPEQAEKCNLLYKQLQSKISIPQR